MFSRAYIEDPRDRRVRREDDLVLAECGRRGIPVERYTAKRIHRRQLPLSSETFICGDVPSMHGAMKQLGIEIPPPADFPASLAGFLHRRIWKSTLASVEQLVCESARPLFAKPAGRTKLFTGRVFSSSDDFYFVSGTSRREPVLCSEVVEWKSEYRVYVIGEDIVSVDLYRGDSDVALSISRVEEALHAYRASGEAPAAYGIDFGVLETGETALVEANDGFSLGAYKIEAAPYTDLLFARWAELLKSSKAKLLPP